MRILILACLALAHSLSAQAIPPGTRFAITPDSRLQLDSMARASIAQHTEQAACVTTSMMRDSAYVIIEIKPAQHVADADSISVTFHGPACEPWQPLIHSHITGDIQRPSPMDYHTTALRGVFGFLMSVKPDSTYTLRAYP